MPGVTRTLQEQLLHFALQQRLVEVDIYRKLSARARKLGVGSQIGHPNPPLQISAKEEKESENQHFRSGEKTHGFSRSSKERNTVFRRQNRRL
jgi:hypothetical protein